VVAVGLGTAIFGVLVAIVLNLYLLAQGDPLVLYQRTVLSYRSALLGDGILLPIANMAAASFLVRKRSEVTRHTLLVALVFSICLTGCVHAYQATHELVNWSMPVPWHWNAIGVWHAAYMAAVATWLALFVLVLVKTAGQTAEAIKTARVVALCVLFFLLLVALDYRSFDPGWIGWAR
jgi:hypothetical protein